MAISQSIRTAEQAHTVPTTYSVIHDLPFDTKLSSSISVFNISDDKINAMIRVGSSDAPYQHFHSDIRPHKPSSIAIPAGIQMEEGDLFWIGFQLDGQEHVSWVDMNPIMYSAAGNSATLFYFSQGAGQPARAGYMGNRKALVLQK